VGAGVNSLPEVADVAKRNEALSQVEDDYGMTDSRHWSDLEGSEQGDYLGACFQSEQANSQPARLPEPRPVAQRSSMPLEPLVPVARAIPAPAIPAPVIRSSALSVPGRMLRMIGVGCCRTFQGVVTLGVMVVVPLGWFRFGWTGPIEAELGHSFVSRSADVTLWMFAGLAAMFVTAVLETLTGRLSKTV